MAKSKAKSKSVALVVSQPSVQLAGGGRKKKRRSKSAKTSTTSSLALPPYVQLMVNPFTGASTGASPPDDTVAATLVWEDVLYTSVTPDAQGNFLIQVNPFIGVLMTTYTLDVNGLSTAAGTTPSTNYTNIASTFGSYRPMIACVEVEYVGTHDAAKGYLGVAVGNMGLVTVGSSLTQLTDERSYKEVSVSNLESVAAVAKYTTTEFVAVGSTTENSGQTLQYMYIGGSGLAAGNNSIRVKIRHMGDYVARVSSLLQTQAEYTPHHPASLATANSILGPNAETAGGTNPVKKLTDYRTKAAKLGAELNGLVKEARQWAPVVAEFMALMA